MKTIYIQCSCYSEGMLVEYDEEDKLYYISYLGSCKESFVMTWRNRLRSIVRILTKGRIYTDQLVMRAAPMRELITFLRNTGIETDNIETYTVGEGITGSIDKKKVDDHE